MNARSVRFIAAVAASVMTASVLAAGPYEGEIRKIDKSAAKITIRHGPMPKLDMPAMTMVFQVKDKALLDAVKPGDKVRFDAEKAGGAFFVTEMQAAP